MAELKTLQDLLNLEIQMLYSAEKLVLAGLPRLAQKANCRELATAFQRHLSETRTQRERLKQIGELLGLAPDAETNHAMKCLFAECEQAMPPDLEAGLLDAAIIAAARKIEHYEISSYRMAAFLANELGHAEVADLLYMNLAEEQKADALLDALVTVSLHQKAA